ncbi:MAG: FAD-dependent oxidoreductase [Candidatus Omnitrophota bacterium]
MSDLRATFIEQIPRTQTVRSFRFSVNEKINFRPGQFLQVIFDEANPQNKDLNKYLSFSCAPGKDYVEVTKRISESSFSKRLTDLKKGDSVLFKAPLGNCVFENQFEKIGFLIGGIGITPVISILEYISDKHLATDACLIYANKNEKDIAFEKELDAWSRANNHIHLIYTIDQCDPASQKYCSGAISKEFLMEHGCDFSDRVVFISGPPGMVRAMKDICLDIGCIKERIRAESFIGY